LEFVFLVTYAPPARADQILQAAGQCERQYQQCEDDPNSNKAVCENNWRSCLADKCEPNDSKSTEQCPNDPDCESYCTEDVSSQTGLLSCCLGGPKHSNTCPKEVDGKCILGDTLPGALSVPSNMTNPVPMSWQQPEVGAQSSWPQFQNVPYFGSEPNTEQSLPAQVTNVPYDMPPAPGSYDSTAMFNMDISQH
jgi:hypothetical protein